MLTIYKILGLLFLLLGVFSGEVFSAPSNLTASGTVSTGSTVTITGVDFGTGPTLGNIKYPTSIDATAVGSTPSNAGGWIYDQPTGTAAVVSTQAHSGGKSLLHVPTPNSVLRFDYGSSIGTGQTIFVTWWTRRTTTTAGQWKMFRVHPTNDIEDSYVPEFHMFNWYIDGSDNFGVRPGPDTSSAGTDSYMNQVITDVANTWYRMELLVTTSSAVGAADGVFEMRRYIPGSSFASSIESGKMTFNSASNNFYRWFQWQNYQGNTMTGLNAYTDDHIVQVGSQARVELCDSPSWASRTSCDMQIPTSWSSGSIAVTVNTGAFAAESPAYLYVVDSTGAVNSLGYEVEIGASGGVEDTTPPVRSLLAPSGALAAGTTSTAISLVTDEAATCRYSTSSGTAYASMTNDFSSSYSMSHSATVSGLTNGSSYTYYVRCIDGTGNANTTDSTISFSVASSAGTAGVLSFEYSTYSAERSDVRIPINIVRTGGSTGIVTAQWSSNGQTATHGVDYYGNDNVTVTFADGVTTMPINTYGTGDDGIEMIANGADDDRYFQMILSNPTGGATLGTTLATVTIEGDYVAPVPGSRVGVGRTPIGMGSTPITHVQ